MQHNLDSSPLPWLLSILRDAEVREYKKVHIFDAQELLIASVFCYVCRKR